MRVLVVQVKLSSLNKSTVRTLAPLVIISFVNVTSGLAGTKRSAGGGRRDTAAARIPQSRV